MSQSIKGLDSLQHMESEDSTNNNNGDVSASDSDSGTASLPTSSIMPNWYGKPEMLPFLSLCSRYPGGPWAGLLQQSIKEKQTNSNSQGNLLKEKYIKMLN